MPENSQFWPKSKAIGLPFLPKIAYFQLSLIYIRSQRVPEKSQFWPKSKAIGLPFLPKIAYFQLSSFSSTN